MKQTTVLSEIPQLSCYFLFPLQMSFLAPQNSGKKKGLPEILYVSLWTYIGILGISAVKFHLLCAILVKTVSLNY